MNHFMQWMTESFAPRMNKIAKNPWIASIQDSILTTMPVILIGSLVTILTIFQSFIPGFQNRKTSRFSRHCFLPHGCKSFV